MPGCVDPSQIPLPEKVTFGVIAVKPF